MKPVKSHFKNILLDKKVILEVIYTYGIPNKPANVQASEGRAGTVQRTLGT